MGLITWDYQCSDCDTIQTEMLDRSDVPDHVCCHACGGRSHKVYSKVHARTEKTSKSRVDGQKSNTTKELLKSLRTEAKAYNQPQGSDERKGLLKEAEAYKKIRKK